MEISEVVIGDSSLYWLCYISNLPNRNMFQRFNKWQERVYELYVLRIQRSPWEIVKPYAA